MRIIRWEQRQVPVTWEVVERTVREMILPGNSPQTVENRVLRVWAGGWPHSYAPYSERLVDDLDRIWVEEKETRPPYEWETAYRRWLIFDASAQALGRVAHPSSPEH